ncbi:MAG: bifunctional pyr operon transcriptional regulator/uracil phosphoribosyltransferase PyrR [Bacteroidia bacterium]|nr:bifunctional pyr operon transcriptional regulator/uracil phosphoribosyltransferase PyrR [Bacteroidota bacterium]MCC7299385.1 bifunctional pyr operon transcriptional regulator/uracil phosphoribosyltransferase PyrR [Bacteroidia bacterium]
MIEPRVLLSHKRIELIIRRFALQIGENHGNMEKCAVIGLQPRGVELSRRLQSTIQELYPQNAIKYGELDNSFFRDDIGRGDLIVPSPTKLDFSTEGLHIILVDDVLFTGRSVRAGIDALMNYGRPASVELMVLIDRRFNRELPIAADYAGAIVDSRSTGEHVKVEWKEHDNKVWLLSK